MFIQRDVWKHASMLWEYPSSGAEQRNRYKAKLKCAGHQPKKMSWLYWRSAPLHPLAVSAELERKRPHCRNRRRHPRLGERTPAPETLV